MTTPPHTPRRVPPVIGIVGRSGAGKTTLIEKLIPALKARGYRVGTIKHHAHPGFEIDRPGKDTWRHAQAGSDHVVIAAPDKLAAIRLLPHELDIHQIAAQMDDVDIILTDGYSRAPIPKIEIVRAARSAKPICPPASLIALVTDCDLDLDVPRFPLDGVALLVEWLEAHLLRPNR